MMVLKVKECFEPDWAWVLYVAKGAIDIG